MSIVKRKEFHPTSYMKLKINESKKPDKKKEYTQYNIIYTKLQKTQAYLQWQKANEWLPRDGNGSTKKEDWTTKGQEENQGWGIFTLNIVTVPNVHTHIYVKLIRVIHFNVQTINYISISLRKVK